MLEACHHVFSNALFVPIQDTHWPYARKSHWMHGRRYICQMVIIWWSLSDGSELQTDNPLFCISLHSTNQEISKIVFCSILYMQKQCNVFFRKHLSKRPILVLILSITLLDWHPLLYHRAANNHPSFLLICLWWNMWRYNIKLCWYVFIKVSLYLHIICLTQTPGYTELFLLCLDRSGQW